MSIENAAIANRENYSATLRDLVAKMSNNTREAERIHRSTLDALGLDVDSGYIDAEVDAKITFALLQISRVVEIASHLGADVNVRFM